MEQRIGNFYKKIAVKIKNLPRLVILAGINLLCVFIFLIVFISLGNSIYGPRNTLQSFMMHYLRGDWEYVYEMCEFPENAFLSPLDFVNAHSYVDNRDEKEESGGQVSNFKIKKQKEAGENKIYEISCRIENQEDDYVLQAELVKGDRAWNLFQTWKIIPRDLYTSDVVLKVPETADVWIDNKKLTEEYKAGAQEGKTEYRIPYLFYGYHTVLLEEEGKADYSDIIEVREKKELEIFPELKLNQNTGREIAERMNEAVDQILEAAMEKESFTKIRSYLIPDEQVLKKARERYEDLLDEISDSNRDGIYKLAVTDTNVEIADQDGLKGKIELEYTGEQVKRRFWFFYKNESFSGSTKSTVSITKDQDQWCFDENIIPEFKERNSRTA